MFYREFAVSPLLRDFIQCIWVMQAGKGLFANADLLVPGGNIEVMLNYGDPIMAMQKKSGKFSKKNNPFALMKHYVFSNTLDSVEEEFILVKGDVKKQVEAIRNEPGKDIMVFGGAHLACSLINLELVDELVVGICPVLLGGGKAFFAGIDKKIQLSLNDSKIYASGLAVLTYSIESKHR